jgi:hypothetical protein
VLSSCIEETPRIPETPPSVPWMLEPRPPHTAQDAGLQLQKGSTDYHGQSHNTFFWVGDPVPVSGKGHRSSSSSLFRVRSRNGSVMTSFPRTVCLSICLASSPWLGTDDSPVLALSSGNTEFLRVANVQHQGPVLACDVCRGQQAFSMGPGMEPGTNL